MRLSCILLRIVNTKMALQKSEQDIIINAPWGKIMGLAWGDPKNPPVLLCPGRITPCSSYRPLVSKLPKCFYYVAIDIPGNGLSDHLPPGVKYTVFDLIPAIHNVVEHFKWDRFIYIGHSLGTVIGTYFCFAYPGRVSRFVQLDPIPLYETRSPSQFQSWYKAYYREYYDAARYKIFTNGKENAPKYTIEEAKGKIKSGHKISDESVEHLLDRYVEPAGDGLYRFTYDQRQKMTTLIPFSPENVRLLTTSLDIPILAILSKESIEIGSYSRVPFVLDESAWKNYRYKTVEGGHEIFIDNPGCMAEDIGRFLQEETKSKL
ncbi:serine hydrolase-like protein isoform X3 [Leptidea sinapis]|uniref:serine hydrolase-like protein isoform X3 n=1 Tax=Leptidea sinapis TaxID=189913 RepID=UPI00213DEF93|nr:serine hydrolase-like protein isoform X3 [Leptidea sinapis]